MIRMLIADDNRVLLKSLLVTIPWTDHGIEVVGHAYDGAHILEQVDDTIDVLVVDIRMPRMDGVEVTQRAIAKCPDLSVIFLSAHSEFTYAIEALKLNVTDYITKPVDNDKLLSTVEKAGLCKQRRLQQRQLLEESLPFMRENILMRLVMGDMRSDLSHIATYFPRWSQHTYFTCMVFDIFSSGPHTACEDMYGYTWQCKKLIESTFGPASTCILLSGVLLLVLPCQSDPTTTQTNQWISDAKQIICALAPNELSVTVGISQSLQGIPALQSLYQQALRALGMRFLLGRSGVFVCPATMDVTTPDNEKAQDALALAAGLCHISDKQYLLRRLSQLSESLNQIEDRALFILTAYSIINDYMRSFLGSPAQLKTFSAACLALYGQIAKATRSESIQMLLDFIDKTHGDQFSQMKVANKKIIRDIYSAIQKVGFDTDGGLESIAREVYLSPSYISMLFKQETGQSISKICAQLRLNKACELLQNPDLKIYEISEQVGYPNPYYFSVWFKKNTGATPSEYRKPFCG